MACSDCEALVVRGFVAGPLARAGRATRTRARTPRMRGIDRRAGCFMSQSSGRVSGFPFAEKLDASVVNFPQRPVLLPAMALDPNRWTMKTQEAFNQATEAARSNSNPEVTNDHLLAALLRQE